jgi:hypothetical protein
VINIVIIRDYSDADNPRAFHIDDDPGRCKAAIDFFPDTPSDRTYMQVYDLSLFAEATRMEPCSDCVWT